MALWSFGLAQADSGVGNLVFVDANANGKADPGEGKGGVEVGLFAAGADPLADAPLAVAVTDADGFYLISGVPDGSYFLQVKSANFLPAGPLYQHAAMLTLVAGDDDMGQDTILSYTPETTGVRSGEFTLTAGSEALDSSGETGFEATADADADADMDLTMDLGFIPAPPLAVGNVVFFDRDGDGTFDAGEGIPGVTVELYGTTGSTALATTTTDATGSYLFDGLVPADYSLKVPALMFAPGAPLYSMKSVPGVSTGDDEAGEDGEDATTPASTGVVTAVFQLRASTAPVAAAEAGFDAESDLPRDADVDLTRDFGFVDSVATPGTFAQWQAQNSLGGLNGPLADPEGDELPNLLEYALAGDPASGLPSGGVRLEKASTGGYQLSFRRRRGSPADLGYTVQVSPQYYPSGSWATVSTPPLVQLGADGTETLTFTGLENEASVASQEFGFVRLTVRLDADGNGAPENEVHTDIQGWQRRTLPVAHLTLGRPFAEPPAFVGIAGSFAAGAVDLATSANGQSISQLLLPGRSYYLEVCTGPIAGHRIEVDEAASTGTSLALLPGEAWSTTMSVSTGLPGQRIALQTHRRINDLHPTAGLTASNNPSQADTLLFYDPQTGAWRGYWLHASVSGPRWVLQTDATLADAGSTRASPVEGVFIKKRGTSILYQTHGMVRKYVVAVPLHVGNNLIPALWPQDESPLSRGLNTANGFIASSNPSNSDRLLIWQGDLPGGGASYSLYPFMRLGSDAWWVSANDANLNDISAQPLFPRGTSFFLRSRTARTWLWQPSPGA
jgi:hypothetical protein